MTNRLKLFLTKEVDKYYTDSLPNVCFIFLWFLKLPQESEVLHAFSGIEYYVNSWCLNTGFDDLFLSLGYLKVVALRAEELESLGTGLESKCTTGGGHLFIGGWILSFQNLRALNNSSTKWSIELVASVEKTKTMCQ